MILIMCMAGVNSRFHDAGFDVPKYLLPWDDGVILDGILRGLGAATNFSRIILLPNRRDFYFKKDLVEVGRRNGIAEQDIVYIPDTKGQSHTAAIGAQIVRDGGTGNEPIAFHNADTILLGRDCGWVAEELRHRDVFIDVFPASNPAYSYLALHDGRVNRIKEKTVISPFASSGFYAFKTADYYLQGFDISSDGEAVSEQREIYISGVIQAMIDAGADVFVNELVSGSTTIVLGSPEEYGLEMARKALAR